MSVGLFVGLVTLDLIYLSASLPQVNQKQVALDYSIAAGGPATNAAIAFRFLSGSAHPASANPAEPNIARLMGVIGNHPVGRFVLADLLAQQIEPIDLQPDSPEPPPTSSILVTQATGERAVISINATRIQASPEQIPTAVVQAALQGVQVVLIDGHQMALGLETARQARAASIPVVIDAGSWKPGFEAVLRCADAAICSANFLPPCCQTQTEVLDYLQGLQIPRIAITRGEQPILYRDASRQAELSVPSIQAVDTLGAGDIFHGAFCYFLLHSGFVEALDQAAQVAALACQSFGTRAWMQTD
ncbi:MAG: sugar kinase [Pegethrix bostrychoides GSE-TBD4-15B]|jgi:sugar/nucleoside kinase (ribokinase family)|uniref:Sugar kinase n=1 Tax=Pegethrix bostrychoides GSE-TBD4-15B TaxID=2839662 RepID=A0A951PAC8_9CYAN|nr:sugar kinase [Pegethrix bostrychoides GSE-TBD4-15B]